MSISHLCFTGIVCNCKESVKIWLNRAVIAWQFSSLVLSIGKNFHAVEKNHMWEYFCESVSYIKGVNLIWQISYFRKWINTILVQKISSLGVFLYQKKFLFVVLISPKWISYFANRLLRSMFDLIKFFIYAGNFWSIQKDF